MNSPNQTDQQTADIVDLFPTDEHFGNCPHCRRSTAMLNIGKDHWMYCEPHRVTWHVGYNLFSGWQHETEAQWQKNARFLSSFRVLP